MNNNIPSFGPATAMMGAPASNVLGAPTALNQVSPNAPSFQPGLLPPPAGGLQRPPIMQPQAQPAPQVAPIQGASPVAPQMPTQMGVPQPQQGVVGLPPSNPEAMMLIKALASRLNTVSKAEEMSKGIR